MIDSKKIAWAALLSNGTPRNNINISIEANYKRFTNELKEALEVGIDWKKSGYADEEENVIAYSEPESYERNLYGTLTLENGHTIRVEGEAGLDYISSALEKALNIDDFSLEKVISNRIEEIETQFAECARINRGKS